jgi:hypothetical protein
MTLAVVSYLGGTVEEVADLTDRRGPHGPRDREAVVAHARLEDRRRAGTPGHDGDGLLSDGQADVIARVTVPSGMLPVAHASA